jgi:hypothetical protein
MCVMASARVQLRQPCDLHNFALGVIINAGKTRSADAVPHRAPFDEPTLREPRIRQRIAANASHQGGG